jgi:hypothetical protein
MHRMQIATSIHFGLAFLVALCALIFSWNSLGRRVMNVVLGIQVVVGFVVAGIMGANHVELPSLAIVHLAGGLIALGFYGAARPIGDRPGKAGVGLVLSILGLLTVAFTLYLGLKMGGIIA